MLNFNNLGSSTIRHEIQDPNEIFVTPNKRDPRKFINNNNNFTSNSMDLDIGLSLIMVKELQQLRKMISRVPGVVQPVPKVSPTSHSIFRFIPAIVDTEVPKCF